MQSFAYFDRKAGEEQGGWHNHGNQLYSSWMTNHKKPGDAGNKIDNIRLAIYERVKNVSTRIILPASHLTR